MFLLRNLSLPLIRIHNTMEGEGSGTELHVYPTPPYNLGIYADTFPYKTTIDGIRLSPPAKNSLLWNFHLPKQRRRGVLFHMGALVRGNPMDFSITDQAYLLKKIAGNQRLLLFSGRLHRLQLNENRWQEVTKQKKWRLPRHWPAEMIERVIKRGLLKIVVLNAHFLAHTLFESHGGVRYFRS